jgi:hypothetical protein
MRYSIITLPIVLSICAIMIYFPGNTSAAQIEVYCYYPGSAPPPGVFDAAVHIPGWIDADVDGMHPNERHGQDPLTVFHPVDTRSGPLYILIDAPLIWEAFNAPLLVKAELRMYCWYVDTLGSCPWQIHWVKEPWDEIEVTWRDRVAGIAWTDAGGTAWPAPAVQAVPVVTNEGYKIFDITILATNKPGPVHGLLVKPGTTPGTGRHPWLFMHEDGTPHQQPYVVTHIIPEGNAVALLLAVMMRLYSIKKS